MGGLWVDYNLMSTIPGLFVIGEANFSDHGANRLGASALMQGLADGYFVIPYTIGTTGRREARRAGRRPTTPLSPRRRGGEVKRAHRQAAGVKGKRSVDDFHRELGKIMWDSAAWRATKAGLERRIGEIPELREEFWEDVRVPGENADLNQSLEKAGRVADFLEFGELMAATRWTREESCGGHFREEHQTEEGEAQARRRQLQPTSPPGSSRAWARSPSSTRRALTFEYVKLTQRSYKLAPKRRSHEPHPRCLASAGTPEEKGIALSQRPTTAPTSTRTCRSWRCSTCSTSALIERARSRSSPSTTTAARASAACARCVINGRAKVNATGRPKASARLRGVVNAAAMHMRSHFSRRRHEIHHRADGSEAFPIELRDLIVDPKSFDRIIQMPAATSKRGQHRRVSARRQRDIPIGKQRRPSGDPMDAAACIGCGACECDHAKPRWSWHERLP